MYIEEDFYFRDENNDLDICCVRYDFDSKEITTDISLDNIYLIRLENSAGINEWFDINGDIELLKDVIFRRYNKQVCRAILEICERTEEYDNCCGSSNCGNCNGDCNGCK